MSESLVAIAMQLGALLNERGWMAAAAESCTGGWLAKTLTDIPGSSAWFDRGFITYSNQAKMQMLGVHSDTLDREGAVSEAVVREMVSGALIYSDARIAVAISGIAGPDGGTPEKPVGTVWFAWAISEGIPVVRRFHFRGDREEVRRQAVRAALQGMLDLIG